MRVYESLVYDLTKFGLYKISSAIFTADADNDIEFFISYNNGSAYHKAKINKRIVVPQNTGKIVVRVNFLDTVKSDLYTIKVDSMFPMLEAGTTVYFENDTIYTTSIGADGAYSINLPRGKYIVYYFESGSRVDLILSYDPELITPRKKDSIDKEAIIENFLRGIDWAENCIFDTFSDGSKSSPNSTTIVDQDGDLSDGETDRKVRYWALAFKI